MTDIIEKSIERSVQYGINPAQDGAPEATRLSDLQLQRRIDENHEFYSVASYELNSLYNLLRNTGFCSALTDQEGYVLYTTGDQDILDQYNKRRCSPGYRWSEKDMGTCAIGLALKEKIPVFLPGEKMFVSSTQHISNAGAPIFSPDGRKLLGVICLSGYSEKMHVHTLGLVRQSAERIRAVLREKEHMQELELQNQYMKALLESNSRGMITVDKESRIVRNNKKARSLLGLTDDEPGQLLSHYIRQDFNILKYLRSGTRIHAKELHFEKCHKSHFISLDPIYNNSGGTVGGLITIIEKDEMMRMALELTGSQALFTFESIIGESEKQHSALHLAKISAGSTVSVLLAGETGTGKELFAQAIHNESDRRNQPFIAINCGAIPNELFESELFGYEEGAFSGAQKGGRPGKLELANNGTLFLDEIGDMPFDMQVKLLRVLQSGELQRVGGFHSVPVNLRIISATNLNLQKAISEGKFRDDLYYRICTLKIDIPPLRERPEDILPLTKHFIHRHELELNRQILLNSEETIKTILKYDWPGNIRQLENAVERAVHICEGANLLPEHFGIPDINHDNTTHLATTFNNLTFAEIEKHILISTINELSGNIRQAATKLDISRPTIYRKLKQYGISTSTIKKQRFNQPI
ncbi:sigma-54-dependent Fis family transcriptional regulator [Desulforhopalus sp. 52FAK]